MIKHGENGEGDYKHPPTFPESSPMIKTPTSELPQGFDRVQDQRFLEGGFLIGGSLEMRPSDSKAACV